jgi:hypothetical protein
LVKVVFGGWFMVGKSGTRSKSNEDLSMLWRPEKHKLATPRFTP